MEQEITYKKCSKCGEEKPLTSQFFYTRKDNKDGFRNDCKECSKSRGKKFYKDNTKKICEKNKEYYYNRGGKEKKRISQKKWILENKEKLKEYQKKWILENKEKVKEYSKKYYENGGKEKMIEYKENNKEIFIKSMRKYEKKNRHKRREKSRKYYHNNKKEVLQKSYIRYKKKLAEDEFFRIKESIRNLIRNTIVNQNYTKKSRTHKILGCDWETFKEHIESQFIDDMTWDNHGEWHYDHYYPVSLAQTEEDMYIFNHYTNFQPLWAKDNLSKSNNTPDGFEEWYEMMKKKVL